ncbi:hypothetical protein [Hymenobacter sp. BT730]|uniref:hypothetical protein n=1 Tax=Hymenobacter sp. BT730 TaxID=3063332 RepID=UPI0026E0ED62|nr:hypothetical protein [Hymenobacter sp. BT730]
MRKLTILLGLSLLGACSADEPSGTATSGKRIITANDFESVAGWNVDPSLLDRGRARSGQYAIKVDQDHEFSLTFDMPLGQATPSKIKHVRLEAWAYLLSEKSTGVLGVQIMEPGTNNQTFGDDIKLGDVVKAHNKWVHVSKDITLPDNITALQHIRLSLWRANASDAVLVDDVKLSILD